MSTPQGFVGAKKRTVRLGLPAASLAGSMPTSYPFEADSVASEKMNVLCASQPEGMRSGVAAPTLSTMAASGARKSVR